MLDIFTMFGASFTLVMCLMLVLWTIYFFQRNAGIIDIGWGLGFIICAWSYFFLGNGDLWKMMAITAMATLWAARLSWHIYQRYRRADAEDPRYSKIRQQWGGDSNGLLFLILFLFQGLLIVVLSLPFFLVSHGSSSGWSYWELWGVILWAVGLAGEALADSQLASFKADPDNKGKVCKKGLWRFSRHPNYFFDFVVWVGFCLFAFPSTAGWLGIIAPALALTLLVKVTGIPPTEEEAIKTKGDAYVEYQKSTSAFIPWFPKF